MSTLRGFFVEQRALDKLRLNVVVGSEFVNGLSIIESVSDCASVDACSRKGGPTERNPWVNLYRALTSVYRALHNRKQFGGSEVFVPLNPFEIELEDIFKCKLVFSFKAQQLAIISEKDLATMCPQIITQQKSFGAEVVLGVLESFANVLEPYPVNTPQRLEGVQLDQIQERQPPSGITERTGSKRLRFPLVVYDPPCAQYLTVVGGTLR